MKDKKKRWIEESHCPPDITLMGPVDAGDKSDFMLMCSLHWANLQKLLRNTLILRGIAINASFQVFTYVRSIFSKIYKYNITITTIKRLL